MSRKEKIVKPIEDSFDGVLESIGKGGFVAPKKETKMNNLINNFENSKQEDGNGIEFWYARDLMKLLEYIEWRNFELVIKKSKKSCKEEITNHFVGINKMVSIGSEAQQKVDNYKLTRYACYLIAMNGDPKKETIQFAKNYFAIQTRKQELQENNEKIKERIKARNKLAEIEKKLSRIVYERGFTNHDFGTMRSKGDEALFGGSNTRKMKDKLNVPSGRPLADFTNTVIVKAKDLAAEVTSHNVLKSDLEGVKPITDEHIVNNTEVRKYLTGRKIIPENLPPEEDIKKVERKLNKKGIPKQKEIQIDREKDIKINISIDLWKYALLILSTKKNGQILTNELRSELLIIKGLVPDKYKAENPQKKEPYYYQIVRNLKSNKRNKTNFINQGYCEDIKGGFKITQKGIDFVREYFKDYL